MTIIKPIVQNTLDLISVHYAGIIIILYEYITILHGLWIMKTSGIFACSWLFGYVTY
jgi:hypothetical protein